MFKSVILYNFDNLDNMTTKQQTHRQIQNLFSVLSDALMDLGLLKTIDILRKGKILKCILVQLMLNYLPLMLKGYLHKAKN